MVNLSGLADLHTHTFRCGHAVGHEEEYVRKAIEVGLTAVAITDHIPFYWLPPEAGDPTLAMAEEQLPSYLESVLKLKEQYRGEIEVLLGIEADYIEGHEARLAAILERYPFDIVLGSVHWVDGFWVDAPSSVALYRRGPDTVDAIWKGYWEKLEKAIASRLFDVMAHLDLPKKFGFFPAVDLTDWEAKIIAALASTGTAVEVSTAGRRKPVGEDYPSQRLLKQALAAGIPLVLGSDAHTPEEVGFAFPEVVGTLQGLGIKEVSFFRERQRVPLRLSPA